VRVGPGRDSRGSGRAIEGRAGLQPFAAQPTTPCGAAILPGCTEHCRAPYHGRRASRHADRAATHTWPTPNSPRRHAHPHRAPRAAHVPQVADVPPQASPPSCGESFGPSRARDARQPPIARVPIPFLSSVLCAPFPFCKCVLAPLCTVSGTRAATSRRAAKERMGCFCVRQSLSAALQQSSDSLHLPVPAAAAAFVRSTHTHSRVTSMTVGPSSVSRTCVNQS
jgi:hypothetical protein